jgi:plasmid maintenance system antidote protein VapI
MPKKRRCEPLEQYCERHKITIAELATRLTVPEPTLRCWINGHRLVKPKMAVQIENRLGIPRETLRPDIFVKRAA